MVCLRIEGRFLRSVQEQIKRAVVDRDPPTYRAVFDHFELADRGISFTAFYYYARQIRMTAALYEITRSRPADAPDADAVLPEESMEPAQRRGV